MFPRSETSNIAINITVEDTVAASMHQQEISENATRIFGEK